MTDIVGTWRLVKATARDDDGKPLPSPYGPKAMGLVVFQADGRMMAVLCDGRNTCRLTSRDSTCPMLETTLSTAARWSRRSTPPPTRVEVGGEQVRQVRFEGAHLLLNPPRRLWGGAMQHQEMVWERVA